MGKNAQHDRREEGKKNCHPGKAEFLHEAISTDGDLFHPQEIRDSLSGGYVEKGILAK